MKYGIQNADLHQAIQIGRLNKRNDAFLDWEDHTDRTIAVVGEFARDHFGGNMTATFPGLGFDVTVTVEHTEGDQS